MPRASKPRPKTRTRLPRGAVVPDTRERAAFVRALVRRGQAARRGADGELPAGATHEIVGWTPDRVPIIVRRRFSLT
jgi:hypothetical protein